MMIIPVIIIFLPVIDSLCIEKSKRRYCLQMMNINNLKEVIEIKMDLISTKNLLEILSSQLAFIMILIIISS